MRSKFKSTYFNTIFGADSNEIGTNTDQIDVSPESAAVEDKLDTRPTVVDMTGEQLLSSSWLRNKSDIADVSVVSAHQSALSPRSQIASHRHTIRRSSSFDDLDQVRQQNYVDAYALENPLGAHRVQDAVPLRRRHSSETPRASLDLTQSAHARLMHELASELKAEPEHSTQLENSTAIPSCAEIEAKEIPAVVGREKQEHPASDDDHSDLL